ncbi:MAG: peptide ABC transporter substrate-binding protein [Erysipelotrichaceae bacterium]|nr:peptide ABC transporter substrate-binding protein [Erysipelotrichaceae bacterium]
MKKLLTLLLVMLMALSLAACGGGGNTPSGGGEGGGETPSAEPVIFKYAVGDSPNYLDPAIASDSIGSYVINQMYYPLYYFSPNGILPAAAADTKVSDDGLVYTITIVDNKWSDGQPVTAEDFVYGPKHALSLGDAEVSYLAWITDYIVNAKDYVGKNTDEMTDLGIKALDDKTVEYTLVKPCSFFTSLLWGGIYYPLRPDFAPSGDYTWADTVGYPSCGAFYATSIDRAAKIEMAKNENWFDAAKVKVDGLECQVVTDMESQLMAYQADELDFATSLSAGTVSKLYDDSELFASGNVNYYMELNMRPDTAKNPALLDLNVRKAILYGIDRQAICDAIDAGTIYYPLYGFVPYGIVDPTDGDFRESGGDYCSYDPEAAVEFLAKAGYSVDNPLELEYYYNQNTTHDTVAAVLKEQLAKIGINLNLKTGDVRTFFDDRDNQGNFEAARGAMSADYNDALTYLDMPTATYQTKAVWGDTVYDDLMLEIASMSGQERIAKLHEAEKYLVEDQAMVIPLFGYGSAVLRKPYISGDFDNGQGNSIFWYVEKNK